MFLTRHLVAADCVVAAFLNDGAGYLLSSAYDVVVIFISLIVVRKQSLAFLRITDDKGHVPRLRLPCNARLGCLASVAGWRAVLLVYIEDRLLARSQSWVSKTGYGAVLTSKGGVLSC